MLTEPAEPDMAIKGEISGTHKWERECVGAVEFCTNGPQGGGAGHGGFLEVKFTNAASTALEAIVDGKKFNVTESLTLRFLGDAEMEVALECFEFLASKLKAIREIDA